MTLVLTACDAVLEARVATRVEASAQAQLVRRCPDVPDLLAAAAAHLAEVAVVSVDLPGLDRPVLSAVSADGLVLVGVFSAGDEDAERRLRQWGLRRVLPADAEQQRWDDALAIPAQNPPTEQPPVGEGLGGRWEAAPHDPADEDATLIGLPSPVPASGRSGDVMAAGRGDLAAGEEDPSPGAVDDSSEGGRIIAVWGPTGAPGRTTIAVNLAVELSRLSVPTLLVDADTYGASIAQALGLLDESPGLASATRLADAATLDRHRLAAVAPEVRPGLRVLTGLPRADRWNELSPQSLQAVLTTARTLAQVIVVDTGFCLEQDEVLSYDTRAPQRNASTTTVLAAADDLLVVGSADPVGLQRLVRGLEELRGVPHGRSRVVLNRVRASAVGASPERRVTETLERFAGVTDPVLVPEDRSACDAAMLAGQALAEHNSSSAARRAITALAGELIGRPVTRGRRGGRKRGLPMSRTGGSPRS
ncbi:AAA family ATPase [Dermacoccaceae bacterium W4C1]